MEKKIDLTNGKTATITVVDKSYVSKGDAWEGRPDETCIRIEVACVLVTPTMTRTISFGPNVAGLTYTPQLRVGGKFRFEREQGELVGPMASFAETSDYVAINTAITEMVEAVKEQSEIYMSEKSKVEEKERRSNINRANAILDIPDKYVFADADAEREWRRRYNNVHNEGGDGYIPTTTTQERVEWARGIIGDASPKKGRWKCQGK